MSKQETIVLEFFDARGMDVTSKVTIERSGWADSASIFGDVAKLTGADVGRMEWALAPLPVAGGSDRGELDYRMPGELRARSVRVTVIR